MHSLLIFFSILPDFSYSVQDDIEDIVLYEGTKFMHDFSYSVQSMLIFFNILQDFSYSVQADIDTIVLYEGAILPKLGTRSGHACTYYMFRLIQISGHAMHIFIF